MFGDQCKLILPGRMIYFYIHTQRPAELSFIKVIEKTFAARLLLMALTFTGWTRVFKCGKRMKCEIEPSAESSGESDSLDQVKLTQDTNS